MKLIVFAVKDESFRYGDENSSTIKRFSTEELQKDYFKYLVSSYRKVLDLTEYKPGCFEDSAHKWAYEVTKYEEIIDITETKDWEV